MTADPISPSKELTIDSDHSIMDRAKNLAEAVYADYGIIAPGFKERAIIRIFDVLTEYAKMDKILEEDGKL